MASENDTPRNKVATVIRKRELDDLVDELEQRWTGEGFEEHSTRELTEFFNQTLIREAIEVSGSIPLDGEVENLYRLLSDDDIRSSSKIQAHERLAEEGIDAEELTNDFVSHQTMYRFLRDVRDVDTSTEQKSTDEIITATRQSIMRLNNRTKSVVNQNITKLDNRDEFEVGDFDIYVNVQLTCNDCGTTRDVTQILDQNGCDCQS